MLTTFLLRVVLLVLTLLVVVPAATDNGVAVRRGGFFRGFLSLLVIGLLNLGLWAGFTLLTLGTAVIVNVLLCGLVGVFVQATAFCLASRMMPDVLHVRNFGTACWASVIMTVAAFLINHVTLI